VRTFVERWYGEGVTYDIFFDHNRALFDVCAGEIVVFTSSEFVDILHWCMRPEHAVEVRSNDHAIDVSPPDEET
jgi:hypothetical protein